MNRRDVLSGTAAGLAFGGGFIVTYDTLWGSPTPRSVARLEVNSEDSPRPGNESGPQYYAEQPPEIEVDRETKTINISGYLYVGSVDHDLKVETLSYDEATEALTIEMTGYLPLRTGLDYLTGVDRIDRRSFHSYEVFMEMTALPTRIIATEITAGGEMHTTTFEV